MSKIRYKKLHNNDFITSCIRAGMSLKEIAAEVGCSVGSVQERLRRLGLKTQRAVMGPMYPQLTDRELLKRCIESGLSRQTVSKLVGCSLTSVTKAEAAAGLHRKSVKRIHDFPKLRTPRYLNKLADQGCPLNGKARRVIAKHIGNGCTSRHVFSAMRRHGIVPRQKVMRSVPWQKQAGSFKYKAADYL